MRLLGGYSVDRQSGWDLARPGDPADAGVGVGILAGPAGSVLVRRVGAAVPVQRIFAGRWDVGIHPAIGVRLPSFGREPEGVVSGSSAAAALADASWFSERIRLRVVRVVDQIRGCRGWRRSCSRCGHFCWSQLLVGGFEAKVGSDGLP